MAIKYIPYFPNTLEGQAVLDNFVRTKRLLRYRDNDRAIERIERGLPLYEAQLREPGKTMRTAISLFAERVYRPAPI